MAKNLVFGPNLCCQFFLQKSDSIITRYHGQLSSCTIPEKTNDPILINRSDGWMKGQMVRWTDGQMDRWTQGQTESDFIGCCLTNVERTKIKKFIKDFIKD